MWPLVSTQDRQTTRSSICVATSDSFDLHMTQHIFADCLQPALHRTDKRLPPDAYVITKGLCSGCRVGGDKDSGGRGVCLAVAEGTAFRQRVYRSVGAPRPSRFRSRKEALRGWVLSCWPRPPGACSTTGPFGGAGSPPPARTGEGGCARGAEQHSLDLPELMGPTEAGIAGPSGSSRYRPAQRTRGAGSSGSIETNC